MEAVYSRNALLDSVRILRILFVTHSTKRFIIRYLRGTLCQSSLFLLGEDSYGKEQALRIYEGWLPMWPSPRVAMT